MTVMQMSLRSEILQVPGIIFIFILISENLHYQSPGKKNFFFGRSRSFHYYHLDGCLWFNNIKHWCYWVAHFSERMMWNQSLRAIWWWILLNSCSVNLHKPDSRSHQTWCQPKKNNEQTNKLTYLELQWYFWVSFNSSLSIIILAILYCP